MKRTQDAALVTNALAMAMANQTPRAGTIFHSDRGVQFTSHAVRSLLHNHGFVQSMSRRADCYDNALAESFFATLKREAFPERRTFASETDARIAILRYIEGYYNRQRIHSTLGYKTPNQAAACITQNNAA